MRFDLDACNWDLIRDLRDSIWATKDLGPNHEADGTLGRPLDVKKWRSRRTWKKAIKAMI